MARRRAQLLLVLSLLAGCVRRIGDLAPGADRGRGDARASDLRWGDRAELGQPADQAASGGSDLLPEERGVSPTSLCTASAPGCAPETLCDGFEQAGAASFPGWDVIVGEWRGAPASPGSRVAAVAAPVCRGTRALSVTAAGAAQFVGLRRTNVQVDPVYVRLYFYLPSSSSADGFASIIMTRGTEIYQLMLYPRLASGYALERPPQAPGLELQAAVPRDRWTCLELLTRFDASAGSVALWIDGQLVGAYQDRSLPLALPLDELYIGVSTGEAQTDTTQIFYDDIAISSMRRGC